MWVQIRQLLQGSTLFVEEASNISADDKSIRFFVIRAFRVNKCEQCINGQDFHEMHACLRGLNNLLT